eukprot:RCo016502
MDTFTAAAAQYNQMYADDDLDGYDPQKREESLADSYARVERKFDALVAELHIPFLDRKLFRKYFVTQKTEANLAKLVYIVRALAEHKAQTLTLLRLIFEREQLVGATRAVAVDLSQGKVTTLEAQTKVLQLLYSIQQATLRVVEGIQEWRMRLTRPYPFQWRGVNYLLKILRDCQIIESSVLKTVLPLQLTAFPLCSNLTSLSLFGPTYSSDPVKGTTVAITYPMKMSKKQAVPQQSPEMQLRLQQAEATVLSEHGLQVSLMQELQGITVSGAFLTVLNVREAVPNCCEGIRLNNRAWDQRLQMAVSETYKKLDPSAAASAASPTSPSQSKAAAATSPQSEKEPGSSRGDEERRDEAVPRARPVSPKETGDGTSGDD